MRQRKRQPTRVELLLREAQVRIQAYIEQQRSHGRGFVASDFAVVNAALERIVADNIARGPLFCEWGSGFGVITMLASMLGFEACGIEVQAELVQAAEDLADDFSCDVRFAHGSFVSADDADLTASAEHSWWHDDDGTSYEDLDLEPQDVDVFFAYPWPGEEPLFESLFLRYASNGAILMTYHDTSGVLVQRRVDGRLQRVGWY